MGMHKMSEMVMVQGLIRCPPHLQTYVDTLYSLVQFCYVMHSFSYSEYSRAVLRVELPITCIRMQCRYFGGNTGSVL
jgi:hypothetical protein